MSTSLPPTDPNEALQVLLDATIAFAQSESDSDYTLRLALDHLIRVTGADAGAVAIADPNGQPHILAERSLARAGPISRTALQQALEHDSRPSVAEPPATASVLDAGITSILCTPVRRLGKTLAAVYLDRRLKHPFDEVACKLAECFASVLALSLDLTRRAQHAEEQAEEARAAAANAGFWRFGTTVTRSKLFANCLQLVERAARSDVSLLFLGNTGSGKEHLARCVHAESSRSAAPFLTVNCAAIPEALLESELFGHERGAFTGAVQTNRGKFELAHGGVLFLDEIGDLPLSMQPKLLRVLDDKRVTRLGGSLERQVDVRVLAATHRDLAHDVQEGRFREDLFFRLNVISIRIPPLRERVEDIAPLAVTFLEQSCKRTRRKLTWDKAALRRLALFPWPGNVRELRNVVEKLCALVEGPKILVEDVEAHVSTLNPGRRGAGLEVELRDDLSTQLELARGALERVAQSIDAASAVRPAVSQFPADLGSSKDSPAAVAGLVPGDPGFSPQATPAGTFREQMDRAAREIIAVSLRRAGSIAAAARELGLSRQHLSEKCRDLGLKLKP